MRSDPLIHLHCNCFFYFYPKKLIAFVIITQYRVTRAKGKDKKQTNSGTKKGYICPRANLPPIWSLSPISYSQLLLTLSWISFQDFLLKSFPGMLCVLSLQLCSTVCNPMDCSQPSSSVHGICQARILDWVAISSSRGSSPSRDHRGISFGSCIAGRFFTTEPLRKPHIQAYVHILFVSSSNETIQRPLHRKRQKKQSG